jgi:hypothetical protein
VGREETRQGTRDRILKSKRAAQSNQPARLGLHSKRGLFGSLGLDDRRARMFENLLANLGQAESSRRSIKQPNAKSLLQQCYAPTDPRFWHPERACGGREAVMKNDRCKELEIVEVAHCMDRW